MNLLKKIFPPFLRKGLKRAFFGVFPGKLFLGKDFWFWYRFLNQSQWWSRERLEKYQTARMKELLIHCYANIPFYRKVFDDAGFEPARFSHLFDVERLPLLDKDTIRNNIDSLIARNINGNDMEYVTTGGSTGIPLGLYIEKKTNVIRLAFDWREWNWMGYGIDERCAVIRGSVISEPSGSEKESIIHKYDPANNYLLLSSYHMTDENLTYYAKKIDEFKPSVIRGYPSAMDIFATFIKKTGTVINRGKYLKAVATSSETLYSEQKNNIEDAFGCPVFDKYGNCEQATFLGECEKHEGYHDCMEYSYTELLDSCGRKVENEGEIGEIVSTTFTNYAMPLVRYKTADLAEFTGRQCSCGRELPLIKSIRGRMQEMLVAECGNLISMTAINMHSNVFDNVRQFQFYQDAPGVAILKIVRRDSYTETDNEYIMQEMKKKLANQVDLRIEFVDEIKPSHRGKHSFLEQKLKIDMRISK